MSSSKKKELDESSVIMASMNKFKKQNYRKLKASCENEKRLFVDDLFLPNESSIYKSRRLHGIQWKRPHVGLSCIFKIENYYYFFYYR